MNGRMTHKQMIFTSVSCLLALTAFSRCSPLSPSMSKLRQTGGTPKTDSGDIVLPINLPFVQKSTMAAARTFPASVLEFSDYKTETDALPSGQKIVLSSEHLKEDFASFKSTRSVLIRFDGPTPDECKGYLGLSMSETSIETYELNPIETECARTPDSPNTWKFSISPSVSQETWDRVNNSLQSLTVYATTRMQMKVVAPVDSVDAAPATTEGTGTQSSTQAVTSQKESAL
jgi:hypothetical protein